MQKIIIWYMHIILGLKVVLVVVLSTISTYGQGFKWADRNSTTSDIRKISYGFVIGLHTTAYQVKYSNKFIMQNFDTIHSISGSFSTGFSVGFLANLKLADEFDLRLMPKAGFYSHKLSYNYTNGTSQQEEVETTMIEFPFILKYKSARRGNVRMYVIGGFTPSFEASGKNDVKSVNNSLSIKPINFSLDTGLGFDFYFPLFKLSQEIRFSKGIVNLLGDIGNEYTMPLNRLNTNTISVYFIFQ